jgi:hypothetical protein
MAYKNMTKDEFHEFIAKIYRWATSYFPEEMRNQTCELLLTLLDTYYPSDGTQQSSTASYCNMPLVVGSKPTGLMVESGKSYKLRHPNGAGDKDRLHIDYILDNPTNSHWSYKLVVCRYWGKHKQRWFHYTYPYFSLAIYNDWDYGGDDV